MPRSSPLVVLGVLAAGLLAALLFPWETPRSRRDPAPVPRHRMLSEPLPSGRATEVLRPATEPAPPREPVIRGLRIAGRVLVEGGLPQEEVLVRVLPRQGRRRRDAPPPRAGVAVAADGSFELQVAGPGPVRLGIVARTLALPEPVLAHPGDLDVVLRPGRLAALEVQLYRSGGVLGADPWWGVSAALEPGGGAEHGPHPRAGARPDVSGRLDFEPAPIGLDLVLRINSPQGTEERAVPALAPGERRRIEVLLARGLAIEGFVVDEQGLPVPEASVRARGGSPTPPAARADAAGRFILAGLPAARAWVLEASAPDVVSAPAPSVPGDQGDVRGIEIRVERGRVLAGSARWADGAPVHGRLLIEDPATPGGPPVRTLRGDLTPFQLCLRSGTYDLDVRAEREGRIGRTVVRRVVPGGAPLALVLEEQPAFVLLVDAVDPDGNPISDFRARIRLGKDIVEGERVQDGPARFACLPAGTHVVEVRAPGHSTATRPVHVGPERLDQARLEPADEPAVRARLTMAFCGTVRGFVLDAAGLPATDARVGVPGRGAWSCAEDGSFEVPIPRGRVSLSALKRGHARGEAVAVEVAPGEVLGGVFLRLGSALEPGEDR